MTVSQHPRLPAPSRAALLLDLDGTLIDIAPRPELVTVPDDLPASLLAVRRRLDDALAVVSGRPVAQIDALLPGIAYAAAGEHGGAYRFAPGAELYHPDLPHAPDEWVRLGEAAVAAHPGAFVERKTHGFVLHYRAMPDAEGALREAALAIVGAHGVGGQAGRGRQGRGGARADGPSAVRGTQTDLHRRRRDRSGRHRDGARDGRRRIVRARHVRRPVRRARVARARGGERGCMARLVIVPA